PRRWLSSQAPLHLYSGDVAAALGQPDPAFCTRLQLAYVPVEHTRRVLVALEDSPQLHAPARGRLPVRQADSAGRLQGLAQTQGQMGDRAWIAQVGSFERLDEVGHLLGLVEVGVGRDQPFLAGNGERHAVIGADERVEQEAQPDRARRLLLVRLLVFEDIADQTGIEQPSWLAGNGEPREQGNLDCLIAGNDLHDLSDLDFLFTEQVLADGTLAAIGPLAEQGRFLHPAAVRGIAEDALDAIDAQNGIIGEAIIRIGEFLRLS